jgi:hypothetical protein
LYWPSLPSQINRSRKRNKSNDNVCWQKTGKQIKICCKKNKKNKEEQKQEEKTIKEKTTRRKTFRY